MQESGATDDCLSFEKWICCPFIGGDAEVLWKGSAPTHECSVMLKYNVDSCGFTTAEEGGESVVGRIYAAVQRNEYIVDDLIYFEGLDEEGHRHGSIMRIVYKLVVRRHQKVVVNHCWQRNRLCH